MVCLNEKLNISLKNEIYFQLEKNFFKKQNIIIDVKIVSFKI